MADLIGFDGYLNESTPFLPEEHEVVWKTDRHYPDFAFGNTKTSTCVLPRFWDESGSQVKQGADTDKFSATFDKLSSESSCYDSDFDQVRHTKSGHNLSLIFSSTVIPKPLAFSPTGKDNFQNSLLYKTDCVSGSHQSLTNSSTCIVSPFPCSISMDSVLINPRKRPSMR